jgi:hypothetical protein
MKGTVFTEFLDFVDTTFAPDLTEEIIMACDLPSKGAYTATQTYDYRELLSLVAELSRRSGETVPQLVKSFGQHLFTALHKALPSGMKVGPDLFAFLESIDTLIHDEVRKLHPDADLPTIACNRLSPSRMAVQYTSKCPFSDLAQGLLEASAAHFGEHAAIAMTEGHATSNSATFLIQISEGRDDEV